MIELTNKQIDLVHQELTSGGLETEDLLDDLVDHVCCFIESSMEKGLSFDVAFQQAKDEVCPDAGWKEIQEHTDYLIKFKHHIIMRKFMNIVGIVGALIMFLGAIFKIFDWPGAGVCIGVAYLLISFVQLPIMLIVNYKESTTKLLKWMHIVGFIAGFMIVNGVTYKVMHWPGAAVMLFGGVLIFVAGFIPLYFINSRKDALMPVSPMNAIIVLLVVSSLFVAFGTKNDSKYFIYHMHEMNMTLEGQVDKLKSEREIKDTLLLNRVLFAEKYIGAYKDYLMVYENDTFNYHAAQVPEFYEINEGNETYRLNFFKYNFKRLRRIVGEVKEVLPREYDLGYKYGEENPVLNFKDRFDNESMPAILIHYRLTQIERDLANIR